MIITTPGGGGGGAGTVTNTGGALTLNQVVIGAGGNDTKVDGVHSDNGTTLTYSGTGGILSTTGGGLKAGANGGAAGVVTLNGSTSGAATLTAPAVAGTPSNPISVSNQISFPTGLGAITQLAGPTDQAFQISSSNNNPLALIAASGAAMQFTTGGALKLQLTNAGSLGFTSGKGQHILTQAANNDVCGVATSASGTTVAITFTTNYTSTPAICITPTTAGITSAIITTQSNSGFTITYAPSGAATFNYIVIGNPN